VFAALAATQVVADLEASFEPTYPTSFGPVSNFQLSTEGSVYEINVTGGKYQSIVLAFSFENLVTAIGIPDGNKVQNYAQW
jgi:hypothetical protein